MIFNGHYIGNNFSGYAPFRFDVSDHAELRLLPPNVLLVRVDATLGDGWFYEGAGIYRHVWLTKTNPIHVRQWGTFVRSTVRPGGPAAVRITTEVENETDGCAKICTVVSRIVDPANAAIITAISTGAHFDSPVEPGGNSI